MNIAISSLDVGEIRKREDETKNTNSSSFYDSDLIKDRSKRRTFASFFFRACTAAGNSSSMESTKNNDGANGNGKDLSVIGALTLSVVSSVSILSLIHI